MPLPCFCQDPGLLALDLQEFKASGLLFRLSLGVRLVVSGMSQSILVKLRCSVR